MTASYSLLLNNAFVYTFRESNQLFKEVRQNAFKAFNQSDSLDSWVACTQLKMTAAYMCKSYEENRVKMQLFGDMTKERQREIASTIKGYVDDLFQKTDELKRVRSHVYIKVFG